MKLKNPRTEMACSAYGVAVVADFSGNQRVQINDKTPVRPIKEEPGFFLFRIQEHPSDYRKPSLPNRHFSLLIPPAGAYFPDRPGYLEDWPTTRAKKISPNVCARAETTHCRKGRQHLAYLLEKE